MSFLAQLRQNSMSSTATGLQLTYQLRLLDDGLVLRLALAEIVGFQLKTAGQDYVVQPAHLRALPHFLQESDGRALSRLLRCSGKWQEKAELPCNGNISFELLREMAAGGKVFLLGLDDLWRPVTVGQGLGDDWCWLIRPDATQVLTRRLPRGMIGCRIGESDCACRPSTAEIAPLGRTAEGLLPMPPGTVVSQEELDRFLARNTEALEASGLPSPRVLTSRHCPAELDCALVCESVNGQPSVQLVFRYSTERICIQVRGEMNRTISVWDGEHVWLVERDSVAEERAYRQAQVFLTGFSEGTRWGNWRSGDADHWRQLFLVDKQKLDDLDIHLEAVPGFTHQYVEATQWAVDIRNNGGAMQLDLMFQVQGQSIDALELLQSLGPEHQWTTNEYGQVECHVGGVTVVLPQRLCGFLREEFADLMAWGRLGEPIPLTQWYRLRSVQSALPESTTWSGDLALLEQAARLVKTPPCLDTSAAGVRAGLRPYQKLGVAWLQHLRASGVNGLLADDMGLGKTLQTIAHLALEFHSGRADKPALVIAPTSLIDNWRREFEKFCPHLKVQVFHGQKRHDLRVELDRAQIWITSYNLSVLDLETWASRELSWLVLDEAQTIKNPRTQVRRAVAQIPAQFRLCLSGTPVENHLAELWSVMDFLAPGILGNQSQFRSYYQKPIEQQGNAALFSQLLHRVAPLMLRRTKASVADDLPDKTEIKQTVVMGEEQMDFYRQVKQHSWQMLQEELDQEQNEGQKQLRILTAITKLRQVCCDPQLLGEQRTPSAKTQVCVDMVSELVGEGRAVLVFSQFTSMLKILSERFENAGIAHFLLTGSTRDRAEVVEAFQGGDRPLFLISLKAGGVGLNLTRADTVIHYDPWWNLAAEQQASDRVHRIGQTQPVFVYKLVVEDSIEEKIALMQQAKAQLAGQVHEQAELSGKAFSLSVNDLLQLWQDDNA